MISRRVWSSAIILLLLGLALNISGAQELVGAVAQPVSGLFARSSGIGRTDLRLNIVDTTRLTVEQVSVAYSDRSRPLWSPDGQYILVSLLGGHSAILEASTGSVVFTTEMTSGASTPVDFTHPRGWSSNGESIAVDYSQVDGLSSTLYEIDRVTNTAQPILTRRTDEQIMNMPLPPNAISVTTIGASRIERNPVFDDWFIMQFDSSGYYSTFDIGEPVGVPTNVLWNFRTDEYISLDALVPDLWIAYSIGDWSWDGEKLLLQAFSQDLRNSYFLTFHFTPQDGITLTGRAIVQNRTAEHWLDAGDIFFSIIRDYEDGASYVLGEIVDGEYRETPFFTLNGEMFRSESFGDWFMQADEAERNRLSCLFDLALATQLAVNDEAQVVADDGVGLRLRADPDRFSAELQTMAEGTAMTIINGPACSGGYRWWKVELSDGTVGWAAEADASEYFLEAPAS